MRHEDYFYMCAVNTVPRGCPSDHLPSYYRKISANRNCFLLALIL